MAPRRYFASGHAFTRIYDQDIVDIPRNTKFLDNTVLLYEKFAEHLGVDD